MGNKGGILEVEELGEGLCEQLQFETAFVLTNQ